MTNRLRIDLAPWPLSNTNVQPSRRPSMVISLAHGQPECEVEPVAARFDLAHRLRFVVSRHRDLTPRTHPVGRLRYGAGHEHAIAWP